MWAVPLFIAYCTGFIVLVMMCDNKRPFDEMKLGDCFLAQHIAIIQNVLCFSPPNLMLGWGVFCFFACLFFNDVIRKVIYNIVTYKLNPVKHEGANRM